MICVNQLSGGNSSSSHLRTSASAASAARVGEVDQQHHIFSAALPPPLSPPPTPLTTALTMCSNLVALETEVKGEAGPAEVVGGGLPTQSHGIAYSSSSPSLVWYRPSASDCCSMVLQIHARGANVSVQSPACCGCPHPPVTEEDVCLVVVLVVLLAGHRAWCMWVCPGPGPSSALLRRPLRPQERRLFSRREGKGAREMGNGFRKR